jgi:hypothetical protein
MKPQRRGVMTDRVIRNAAQAYLLNIPVSITAAQQNVPVKKLKRAVNAYLKELQTMDKE